MSSAPEDRLQRLLGDEALAGVRRKLRRRFEREEPGAAPAFIRLAGLEPTAHAALCQLTGRPSRSARSMMLDIAELDLRLREAGLAASLRDALERLEGPIVPKVTRRRELQARWAGLLASEAYCSTLAAWLTSPTALTLLKRLGRDPDGAMRLLAGADAVLRRLPLVGATRSQLAADSLGDAHALDPGRPVATLVLAAWRHRELAAGNGQEAAGDPVGTDADGAVSAAESRRETWARAGVLVSELARPALFLNLPSSAHGSTTWLPGEPGYLSLRQLLRRPPTWVVAGRSVFVCENPDIVALAADRLGAACAPLVCTDGMPAAAQRSLFDQLAAAGARLRYHGDFDWAGLRIGNHVVRSWQAEPWRFGADDYLAAVARTPARPHDLKGIKVEAAWDVRLAGVMAEHGLAIVEEAVVESLIVDLGHED